MTDGRSLRPSLRLALATLLGLILVESPAGARSIDFTGPDGSKAQSFRPIWIVGLQMKPERIAVFTDESTIYTLAGNRRQFVMEVYLAEEDDPRKLRSETTLIRDCGTGETLRTRTVVVYRDKRPTMVIDIAGRMEARAGTILGDLGAFACLSNVKRKANPFGFRRFNLPDEDLPYFVNTFKPNPK